MVDGLEVVLLDTGHLPKRVAQIRVPIQCDIGVTDPLEGLVKKASALWRDVGVMLPLQDEDG